MYIDLIFTVTPSLLAGCKRITFQVYCIIPRVVSVIEPTFNSWVDKLTETALSLIEIQYNSTTNYIPPKWPYS